MYNDRAPINILDVSGEINFEMAIRAKIRIVVIKVLVRCQETLCKNINIYLASLNPY